MRFPRVLLKRTYNVQVAVGLLSLPVKLLGERFEQVNSNSQAFVQKDEPGVVGQRAPLLNMFNRNLGAGT